MPNNIFKKPAGIPFDIGNLWNTLKELIIRWKILFFLVPVISIIGFIPVIGHLILQYLGQAASETALKEGIERIGKRRRSHKALQHYMESVIEATQYLNPRGFSQTQTLMYINVPLDDIFIHPRLVIDLPMYDGTGEQHQALLKELRQQPDLNAEEREKLIHRLDITLYPQLGQELAKVQKKQQMTIEDVLLQHTRGVIKEVRKEATQTILKILTDDTLSCRPLDPPDYSKIWRLDDVLFETLKVLAE